MQWRGTPKVLRCDNGPEYISESIVNWAKRRGIRMEYIQPGKPQQNAYVERFNRTVRYEWLAQYCFDVISEVSRLRNTMDLELQSRTPKHGLGRNYTKTAAGHGCVTSTSHSHQKWGLPCGRCA